MNPFNRTIAAVSTPRGKGGIAVIRISGSDAASVASRMFRSKRDLSEYPARSAVYGEILSSEDEVIDTGIAVIYRAPASFTGEDVVEISCHGGVSVTRETLMSAIAHGAVSALAGEFTKRAFVNGKLSLTEAEAVGRLIDADTKERMLLAGGAARGNVSSRIEELSAGLFDVMTALYAAIDYPEEDVGDEGERMIGEVLRGTLHGVNELLSTYRVGRAVSDGVKCVVCGRPNVGKSSLFNCMTGEESAIVTDIAGTTRDILRETVSFGGVTLRISDTAGIRDSDDAVEKIGVERAMGEICSAELIIAVFDGSERLTKADYELLESVKSASGEKIAVINKTDAGSGLTEAEEEKIKEAAGNIVRVSATNNDVRELEDEVARLFGSDKISLGHDAVIWDARQREILLRARSFLEAAVGAVENGDAVDAVCTMAEEALAALNETDGRGINESIVNEVFSRFCVGK